MTIDIVEQLRITAERYGGDFYTESIVLEAADEIERLRAERDKWEKIAKERNPYSWRNLVRSKYGMEDMYER